MQKRFHITTFGCQMNANDSAWLARALKDLGYVESDWAEADIHILNTCSVRGKPENKVYTELGQIRQKAEREPGRELLACVGGCVAQQAGARLMSRSRECRLVFGTDGIAAAPEAIDLLVKNPGQKLTLLDFARDFTERERKIELGPPRPCAFVNIMQGCDNYCAYCIVPYVRGRQKSRRTAAVLAECRELLAYGSREITLLGQNVNSFGQDNSGDGTGFTDLLYQVAALPGLARLRFMTPHPKDLAPELIRAFKELPALAPRLHLPLQSGSDRILRAMGRKYDLARYLGIVEALRVARPDIQLTTDIITGFPGETEEDFQATLAAARTADFVASFSFAYSDRPGTRASRLENKVPHQTALERLGRLQAWQNDNAARILRSRLGLTVEVLLEGRSLKPEMPGRPGFPEGESSGGAVSWHGRDPHGFSVNVPLPPEAQAKPGDIIKVKITGCGKHTLKGERMRGGISEGAPAS